MARIKYYNQDTQSWEYADVAGGVIPSYYVTETELEAKGYLTAIPSEYITETELAAYGYLTSYTETDPTVPAWAKEANKPTYTAAEVGALPADTVIPSTDGLATESYVDTAVSAKITAPTTATVGQILRVKAVDTNGAPTEWEAVNIIPTYTTSNNGQVLGVVDGALAWVTVSSAPTTTRYSVTYTLDTGITASPETSSVIANEAFATILSISSGMIGSVVVTMGGVDVSDTAYNSDNKSISISAVTGDIVITATKANIVGTVFGDAHNISLDDSALSAGTYTLYYEDENGNKLDSFDPIGEVTI